MTSSSLFLSGGAVSSVFVSEEKTYTTFISFFKNIYIHFINESSYNLLSCIFLLFFYHGTFTTILIKYRSLNFVPECFLGIYFKIMHYNSGI